MREKICDKKGERVGCLGVDMRSLCSGATFALGLDAAATLRAPNSRSAVQRASLLQVPTLSY